MYRDRRDLAGLPLSARRIHLEDVITGADLVLPVRRLAASGLDAWAQIVGNGYEGLVAKDEASAYEGGARTGPSRSLSVIPAWASRRRTRRRSSRSSGR